MAKIPQESAERTYRVMMPSATVRAAPTNTARALSYITKHKLLRGREVAGKLGGMPARWVERTAAEGGGYIARELLDEVPE